MKFLRPLIASSLLALTANCMAATNIQISAKFADVPAGTEIPAKPELLAKAKGVDILSSPTVLTSPGKSATIEVTQSVAAPGGSEVPLGVSLFITPTLTEKGNIAFSGKATDRFKHGQRDSETLTVLACVAREIYFKGTATSGSTIVLKGGPATFSSVKKDGATQVRSRELVIYLTFKKITGGTETKPAAKKKPGTSSSGTKSSQKKKSSSN
ncbi:MAG: hypothetical protein ABI318_00605 [Chthoniobacteraceae bacterium]